MLLALIAGNMAAQATLQLTQANWLPTTSVLWNTSGSLPATIYYSSANIWANWLRGNAFTIKFL
ncbi:MAG: hypothetical protein COC05_07515 [Gammaproteobacteria bacterium]|nr:MAG: hypothetical protein COC05_07515 [Gammaproteobacteria bacterium]